MQEVQYLSTNVKVLIRKLPANLDQSDFIQSIIDFDHQSSMIYQYYVNGKQKEKEYKSSQVYIVFDTFKNAQKFIEFYQQQNIIFIDELGIKTEPKINFCQNQEFYIQKTEENRLENSYEQSEVYRQFIENTFESRQQFYQEVDIKKQTPLLESLEEQYKKKRLKQNGVKNERKVNPTNVEQVEKSKKSKEKQSIIQKKKNKKNNNLEFEYVVKT